MSEYLEVAIRAAREAGAILREKVGKVGYREKNPADLVTEADVAAQAKIAEIVSTAFPEHFFIGEEPQSSLGPDAPRLQNVLREEECGSGAPTRSTERQTSFTAFLFSERRSRWRGGTSCFAASCTIRFPASFLPPNGAPEPSSTANESERATLRDRRKR